MTEKVNHPAHYGGGDNPYEVVKVCEAWRLDEDAYLFNAVKYIARAGQKPGEDAATDIEKAIWYLQRRVDRIHAEQGQSDAEQRARDMVAAELDVPSAFSFWDSHRS